MEKRLKIIRKWGENDSGYDKEKLPDNQYILVLDLLTDEEFIARTNGCDLYIGQLINYKDIEVKEDES